LKIFTFLRIASILLRQFSYTHFLIFFQKFGSTNLLSDCKILNFYFLKIIFSGVATAWVATTLGCKVYGLQQVWVATYWVETGLGCNILGCNRVGLQQLGLQQGWVATYLGCNRVGLQHTWVATAGLQSLGLQHLGLNWCAAPHA
jgi:hypothetical protein